MTITNLASPVTAHATAQSAVPPRTLRLLTSLFVVASICALAARCQAQDAAEAAPQERARKGAQSKQPKHVYTDEDLRRSRILTAEDQAKVEARRKAETPTPSDRSKPQDALDATAAPAELPLGDVARRFREQKQARQSRSVTPFHLPMSEPALAAPVIPLQPKLSPTRPAAPVHPPAMNSGPVRRVDPFAKRLSPIAPPPIPSRRPVAVVPPSAPLPAPAPSASAARKPLTPDPAPSPVQPKTSTDARRPVPSQSQPLRVITVQPGDSLWKLAEENLGTGSRWQELLSVNPDITDANRIAAGTRILLPNSAPLQPDTKIIVHAGDTLSQVAQKHYRNARVWQCIAQANPQIADANRIFEGQELLLPAACR